VTGAVAEHPGQRRWAPTLQHLDWDAWRARYDTMTFAEQQAFYRDVADRYPEQRNFNTKTVTRAFDAIGGRDLSVMEIGGWDGYLASLLLGRGDIGAWTNYDLIAVAQATTDLRYRLVVLEAFPWEFGHFQADVLVMCHTVEHMRGRDLARLLDRVSAPYVYIEAPLPTQGPVDWTGYPGSHILELGWIEASELLVTRGWRWRCPNLWGR